jgi:hypothetical protein
MVMSHNEIIPARHPQDVDFAAASAFLYGLLRRFD